MFMNDTDNESKDGYVDQGYTFHDQGCIILIIDAYIILQKNVDQGFIW